MNEDKFESQSKTILNFDPNFQPFGHEQEKFRNLVENVLEQEAISSRSTDEQNSFFKLRFIEDKSILEVAGEMDKDSEKILEIRERSLMNLWYIFFICKIDVKKALYMEPEELKKELGKGHKAILDRFADWEKRGVLSQEDINLTKSYSRIFNGLGDRDPLKEVILSSGFSDKKGLELKSNEMSTRLRHIERLFWVEHFKNKQNFK